MIASPTDNVADHAAVSTADLFELVRATLVDAIGTTSVAVLIRRAAIHAARIVPGGINLVVYREGMSYRYQVPESWRNGHDRAAREELAAVVGALLPLVGELSGASVVRQLVQVPTLREQGIIPREGVARWTTG